MLVRGIVVSLNYLSYWVEKCELCFLQLDIHLEQGHSDVCIKQQWCQFTQQNSTNVRNSNSKSNC